LSAIYIHIPFCKQACYYCDFHFSTNSGSLERMIEALKTEIRLQANYLPSNELQSIYFGGGTPSMLSAKQLENLMSCISETFRIDPKAEITLEANPDDLSNKKLFDLKSLGINRLSIGIQSFNDKVLQFLNRAHDARQAQDCVEKARKAGFENLSIDLIYGIPQTDASIWENDLQQAIGLDSEHISAYCLTIEAQTVFGNWSRKGKLKATPDEFSTWQFERLTQELAQKGYEHYEVSNFAKPTYYSKHNTNYWKKGTYLGIGPSAHSYDRVNRQYNVAHNYRYLEALEKGQLLFEKEILTRQNHINEFILLNLRTAWGCDLDDLQQTYGHDLRKENVEKLRIWEQKNWIYWKENTLFLSSEGKLWADKIASDLFVIEN
jgi:oxygen-independent coproporphyrinogen III oxidase